MRACTRLLTGVALIALSASTAAALSPAEVLVVANATEPDSVTLAGTYARLRGIPPGNVVLVRTTTNYAVSREEYDAQIRRPIRQIIAGRPEGQPVRCIVLIWAVPVRVMGRAAKPLNPIEASYKRSADRAHYRLATAYKLLSTVGVSFPEPRTGRFKPVGELFASPTPAPTPPLKGFRLLEKDFQALLASKRQEAEQLKDESKRLIAQRQLMALQLDIFGLRGLISFVEQSRPPQAPRVDYLRAVLASAERQLAELDKAEQNRQNVQTKLRRIDAIGGATQLYAYAQARNPAPSLATRPEQGASKVLAASDASVDSELAMVLHDNYKLAGPLSNPLHWRRRPGPETRRAQPVIMTSRIDGPGSADAARIIEASLAAEKTGLDGVFYIDAGGRNPEYDKLLTRLGALVTANTSIKVVLDAEKPVFRPDTCPNAALYVGWYSLRHYVPAFTWKPGAVGWHIASFEAEHLRDPDSKEWCVKMIQNGVAGTVGAVAEPLLGSFPNPDEFFGLLLTGRYTLAECYWRTVPTLSWRLTLIGDPLYNPFAANPQLDPAKLPPGLAP